MLSTKSAQPAAHPAERTDPDQTQASGKAAMTQHSTNGDSRIVILVHSHWTTHARELQ